MKIRCVLLLDILYPTSSSLLEGRAAFASLWYPRFVHTTALNLCEQMKYSFWWEFPGSPVVRALRFTAKGMNSIPGQGTKILCAVWLGQKIKEVFIQKQLQKVII